jgi:ABC-type transport system involved in multi-copper enzyme maturation permease subunit
MTTQEQALPGSATITFGRRDYASVLWRLTRMELYKIRRRPLARVLGLIAFSLIGCVFLALFLFALSDRSEQTAQLLLPPYSLNIAVQTALTPSTILIIILMGSSVGSEYGQGTVRLLFTRGPTRTQFFLARLLAALICSVGGILGMALGGLVLGYLLNAFTGASSDSSFLTPAWLEQTLVFLSLATLNWFIFAVIALFFAIVGRSSAAGIAGGIVWFLVEPVVGQICQTVSQLVQGPAGAFFYAVPDYLIGNMLAAMTARQGYRILGSSGFSSLSDPQALLVLGLYLLILIVIAGRLNHRRDITS